MIPPHLLENLPLIADGAPGDWLLAQRRTFGGPAEAVNLRKPEWVQQAHDAFFQAGARVLRTNSAHADALTLKTLDLEERCEAINNSASAVLRAAVGQQALVMGAVGQIAGGADAERDRAYGQQLVYLADTGVDFVLLDAFTDGAEAARVRRLARDAGDVPVLATLAVDAAARLSGGQPLAEAVAALMEAGADAVGAVFPQGARDLAALIAPTLALDVPTAVFLGADGAASLTPGEFAAHLAPLAALRIVILGGGRHIGPAHTAALAQAIHPPQP